jgi:phosphate uptake regulator
MTDANNQEDLFLFGDVTDFDLFKAQVQTIFITLSNEIEKRLKEKDDQIEKIQEQFALLFAGYAEQASVIENILVTFLSDDSEKEKKFRENLSESRRQFLEMLKEGAEDVLAREDPNLAATLTNVVDKKLSN